MGYNMKNLDPVEALNPFGLSKKKWYGEDTNKVNEKLLEFVQCRRAYRACRQARNKYRRYR